MRHRNALDALSLVCVVELREALVVALRVTTLACEIHYDCHLAHVLRQRNVMPILVFDRLRRPLRIPELLPLAQAEATKDWLTSTDLITGEIPH